MKNSKQKENKGLFSNIIGYRKEKMTLERIIDILNNTKKYTKIGSRIPHGLLIYGDPGIGKTCISKEMIKNINRKSFTIRKNKSDGKFVDYINKIFDEAKKNQPSILFLDDLDKFSVNEEKIENNEEYVVVQSLIDKINEEKLNIFVIATANDIDVLPESLIRSGRW